jgi:hypothetical protein
MKNPTSVRRGADAGKPTRSSATLPGRLASLIPDPPQQRTLMLIVFLNNTGSGLFMVSSALYFTRSVGLSAVEVGAGLTIAGVLGMLVGVLIGHLADRFGARDVYVVNLMLGAAAMVAYTFVHTFGEFLVVACVEAIVTGGGPVILGPLIRGFGGKDPVRFRAYIRSVVNLGIAIGAMAAGVGLQIDTRSAYLGLILGNAASFAVAGLIVLLRLPRLPKRPVQQGARRWPVLRDKGFMAVTALYGAMAVHFSLLTFALPLWIVSHTAAPRWMVSVAFVVNTTMVVVFQVRASRGTDTTRGAGLTMRRAGIALLGGMALVAVASLVSSVPAMLLIVVGTVVYSLGEIWHSAAGFAFSFGLAAARVQGQYSGVFALGQSSGIALGPTLMSLLCLRWGIAGWMLLGCSLAAIGQLTPPVVRRVVSGRERES